MRLREARVVVVVLRAPRVLVEQLEAEAGGEAGPGRLAVGEPAGVEAEPVGLDVLRVEAGLVAALAVLVDASAWRRSARSVPPSVGFQVAVSSCCLVTPGLVEHVLVDDERDGVPVLGKPYCLPAGRLPQPARPGRYWFMSTPRVLTGSIPRSAANCGYLPRWSVNTSGAVSAMKPRGEAAPVVAPVLVLDLDLDVRVLLLELVRALLVDGLLVGVPEAVAQQDLAVGGEPPPPPPPPASSARDGEQRGATMSVHASRFIT